MALINSLCSMLRTTPFHRENYSRLILTVIGKFYQRCSDRFSHLVSVEGEAARTNDDSGIALAAQWAQKPELSPCLIELFKLLSGDPSMAAKSQLCRQETHHENSLLGEGAVGKNDLIVSIRNVSALASLYHSVVSTLCYVFVCTSLTYIYIDMVCGTAEFTQGVAGRGCTSHISPASRATKCHIPDYSISPFNGFHRSGRAAQTPSVISYGNVSPL